MSLVKTDAGLSDDERREALYRGVVFSTGQKDAAHKIVRFARELLEDAFSPLHPETAQYEMPVENYAELLSKVKPAFIHHDEFKVLVPELLRECGCDMEKTYFDVPRLRTSTSDGYLTTGIAYAFHPHRDTWYSAPMCQINWWMPLYPVTKANSMAFHPRYWSEPVRNSSEIYNYQEWNRKSRFNAAKFIGKDDRPQPKALDAVDHAGDVRVDPEIGSALVFSAAQLHSSIENWSGRTRLSIDFRTVHYDDVVAGQGAPNVDSRCTGTTMGDYLRCADLSKLPSAVTEPYKNGPLREPSVARQ